MQITRTPIRQRGQGMTEYIIIVALIAVAAIGVYSYFGNTLKAQTGGLAKEMAGESAQAAQTRAGTNATNALKQSDTNANLKTYGKAQ